MDINVAQNGRAMIELAYACGDISKIEYVRLISNLSPDLCESSYVEADRNSQAEWWGSFG